MKLENFLHDIISLMKKNNILKDISIGIVIPSDEPRPWIKINSTIGLKTIALNLDFFTASLNPKDILDLEEETINTLSSTYAMQIAERKTPTVCKQNVGMQSFLSITLWKGN